MQTASDPLYKQCCAILRKEVQRSERQIRFANWIGLKFNVQPPILWSVDGTFDKQTRLWVVLWTRSDCESFMLSTETFYGRDLEKESLILEKFKELGFDDEISRGNDERKWWQNKKRLDSRKLAKSNRKDWFIAYTAFEPVALQEAASKVITAEIDKIIADFSSAGLWCIEIVFGCAIVMFYTEKQLLEAEVSGVKSLVSMAWNKAILPHDEFGVLGVNPPSITYDSKEVFDRDYGGSWFKYTR